MRVRELRDLALTLTAVFVVVWVVVHGGLSGAAAVGLAVALIAGGPGATVTSRAFHSLDRARVAELLDDRDDHAAELAEATRRALEGIQAAEQRPPTEGRPPPP